MILAIISYCCLFLTILVVDNIKILSLYFYAPVLFGLLIYLFLSYKKRLQITFSFQFLMFASILLYSVVNIVPIYNNVNSISKVYLFFILITICIVNLYFSNSKKEIKVNVLGLMVLLMALMIKLYPNLSSQYQILIVVYFMVQFVFLFLLRINTNTERIYMHLVNSEKFNDQKLLYNLTVNSTISEKNKIRFIEKISNM